MHMMQKNADTERKLDGVIDEVRSSKKDLQNLHCVLENLVSALSATTGGESSATNA
jgi:hypothetical protein